MAQTTTDLTTTHWNSDSDSPEVIRARIEQTRANMTEIVNEIQDKLSPERLTAEAKQKIKDATLGKVEEVANMATYKANTWRTQAMETIRQNPIPAALVGIGLGWLLMEGSRSSSAHYSYSSPEYDYNTSRGMRYYSEEKPMMAKAQSAISENVSDVQDKAGEMAQNVQHKVGEVTDTVQTKASEMASNLQAKAGEVTSNLQSKAGEVTSNLQTKAGEVTNKVSEQADYLSRQAQYQAQRAKVTFQNTLEENPLAVGAVALAAGAAIGLMLPITQKEDELMGETRDRLLHQAQDVAKETFKKVERGAQEAYHVVKEEVTNDISTENRPVEEGMSSTSFPRSY